MKTGMVNQQIRQDVTPLYHNLTPSQLIELASQRGEERLVDTGALVVETGAHTERRPNDRFIVRESSTEHLIDWGRSTSSSQHASRCRMPFWQPGRNPMSQLVLTNP